MIGVVFFLCGHDCNLKDMVGEHCREFPIAAVRLGWCAVTIEDTSHTGDSDFEKHLGIAQREFTIHQGQSMEDADAEP